MKDNTITFYELWRKPPQQIFPQKTVLSKYVSDNGFSNPTFFIDDGVSGVTFDRPSFNRMIAEMEVENEISRIRELIKIWESTSPNEQEIATAMIRAVLERNKG